MRLLVSSRLYSVYSEHKEGGGKKKKACQIQPKNQLLGDWRIEISNQYWSCSSPVGFLSSKGLSSSGRATEDCKVLSSPSAPFKSVLWGWPLNFRLISTCPGCKNMKAYLGTSRSGKKKPIRINEIDATSDGYVNALVTSVYCLVRNHVSFPSFPPAAASQRRANSLRD